MSNNMTLQEIQQKLSIPKSKINTFGNYNYRNCEGILEAVKPLLGESKLNLTDEVHKIGERYYVKAIATLFDGIEKTISHGYARESEDKKGMDAAQITGAASSYARKYALGGLFLIDDGKDADSEDNTKEVEENIEPTNRFKR